MLGAIAASSMSPNGVNAVTRKSCPRIRSFVFLILVTTVIIGMMPPLQGASLVYNIATILGLDLLQELPQKTLIVTGMRKTNDLIRGHDFLVTAFTPFGDIEEAAIAPSNRGFGKSSLL